MYRLYQMKILSHWYSSTPMWFSQIFWPRLTWKNRDDQMSNNSRRLVGVWSRNVFAFVIWWRFRPRAGKKVYREKERKKDVTPWEPTVRFHGFCSVKVIRYYNESALLTLRRYPCSRSARSWADRSRSFVRHDHVVPRLSLVRSIRYAITIRVKGQYLRYISSRRALTKAKCREETWRAKETFDTLTKRHSDVPCQINFFDNI